MKKILILYTSVGLGHKSMAENIGWQLNKAGFEVRLEDILKVQAGRLVDFGTKIHHVINSSFPFIWSWLYKSRAVNFLTLPLRVKLASRNWRQTKTVIDEFQPDLVISVQTTASAIVSYLKKAGLYKGLFIIGFSDFHLHRYWLYDQADYYLANIEEQKQEMVKLGINPNKIFVCGMTLKDKPEINTNQIREKLEIKPNQKVVLVAAGSLGIGLDLNLLDQLAKMTDTKIVIVCGKSQKWFNRLTGYFKDSDNVKVLGFYCPMDELYAVSDVFVSKPGGLSTSEALQWQLPMVISSMLPGQEELNYVYLTGKRLVIPKSKDMVGAVNHELETAEAKKSLADSQALKVLLRPYQAVEAVKKILSL